MAIIRIVIPIYNEEFEVEATCIKIIKLLDIFPSQLNFQIFNDGSTDKSEQILRNKLSIYSDSVQIVSFQKNMGLNYIERQMKNSFNEDYILFIPADNRFSLESLVEFITFIINNKEKFVIFQATPFGKLRGTFRETISKIVGKLVEIQLFKVRKFERLGLICLKKDYYNCYPNLRLRWGGTVFYRSIVASTYEKVGFMPIEQQSEEPFSFKISFNMLKRMPSAIIAILIYPWLTFLKVKNIE